MPTRYSSMTASIWKTKIADNRCSFQVISRCFWQAGRWTLTQQPHVALHILFLLLLRLQ